MKLIVSCLFLFFFFSCNNEKEKSNSSIPDCNGSGIDSVKPIGKDSLLEADDFPFTDEMLRENYSDHRQVGNISSRESAWFVNDSTKEVLIFSVATDLHRLKTFYFSTKEIPEEIFSAIDLHTESGSIADNLSKENSFPRFIHSATKISARYFKSNKEIKLGDCKEKLVRIYGQPGRLENLKGIEMLEWVFEGSHQYKGKPYPINKIIAKESFGHTVTMFFRNQRLIGYMLYNDMP